ncbi:MAG TPA: cytochrome P450 [Clostridia bacterium]|nr:cytochrome P450 [Clostridia bacterium]
MTTTPAHIEEADAILRRLMTEHQSDPYPLFARLRELDPVHRSSMGNFWVLTRYEDVQKILKDKRFVRHFEDFHKRSSGTDADTKRSFAESQSHWLIFSNPPEYHAKRAVYNSAIFSGSRVKDLRPLITSLTDELLNSATDRGEIDIVGELGYQLTIKVMGHIMGLPGNADIQPFIDWAAAVGPTFEPLVEDSVLRTADKAMDKLNGFLGDRIKQRHGGSGEDLLSRSVAAMEAGTLTQDEVLANAGLLYIAGFETTTHFLGNAVYSLLRHRDQWELFTSDPARLVDGAVEELLRFESSVQAEPPHRIATEDIQLPTATIPAGDTVVPLMGAANRDPERFKDPDRLDITRKDIRPLSFGGGIHVCIGQHLARLETNIVLVELARRFPGLELCDEEPEWLGGITARGLRKLKVRLK